MRKDERLPESIKVILWQSEVESNKANAMLNALMETLENPGSKHSAPHLRCARGVSLTFQKVQGFALTTTTPLERVMRELNRKAELNARWS